MGTAIKHCVLVRVKQSFVSFDIPALWRSALSDRVPGCQKLQMMATRWSGTGCFIAVPIWQQWASKGWGNVHHKIAQCAADATGCWWRLTGRSASACHDRRLTSASFREFVQTSLSSFVSDDNQCLTQIIKPFLNQWVSRFVTAHQHNEAIQCHSRCFMLENTGQKTN